MANEVLQKVGGQWSFADHATDFNPTAANDLEQGTPNDVQLDMTDVADGAARASAKFDLGATWGRTLHVMAALEFAATPVAGDVVEVYVGWSPDGTAANGNPGGLSGSDAAYTGYSSNLAASIKQLDRIGTFVCTAQATGTVQIAEIGFIVPKERYGILVVKNESGAAFHSDAVETHVVFNEIIDEIQ